MLYELLIPRPPVFQGPIVATSISDDPATLVWPGIEVDIVLAAVVHPTTAALDFQVRLESREGIVARIVIPEGPKERR